MSIDWTFPKFENFIIIDTYATGSEYNISTLYPLEGKNSYDNRVYKSVGAYLRLYLENRRENEFGQ